MTTVVYPELAKSYMLHAQTSRSFTSEARAWRMVVPSARRTEASSLRLLHRLHAVVHGHEDRGLQRLHRAAGGGGERCGRGGHGVGQLDDHDGVRFAEGEPVAN